MTSTLKCAVWPMHGTHTVGLLGVGLGLGEGALARVRRLEVPTEAGGEVEGSSVSQS